MVDQRIVQLEPNTCSKCYTIVENVLGSNDASAATIILNIKVGNGPAECHTNQGECSCECHGGREDIAPKVDECISECKNEFLCVDVPALCHPEEPKESMSSQKSSAGIANQSLLTKDSMSTFKNSVESYLLNYPLRPSNCTSENKIESGYLDDPAKELKTDSKEPIEELRESLLSTPKSVVELYCSDNEAEESDYCSDCKAISVMESTTKSSHFQNESRGTVNVTIDSADPAESIKSLRNIKRSSKYKCLKDAPRDPICTSESPPFQNKRRCSVRRSRRPGCSDDPSRESIRSTDSPGLNNEPRRSSRSSNLESTLNKSVRGTESSRSQSRSLSGSHTERAPKSSAHSSNRTSKESIRKSKQSRSVRTTIGPNLSEYEPEDVKRNSKQSTMYDYADNQPKASILSTRNTTGCSSESRSSKNQLRFKNVTGSVRSSVKSVPSQFTENEPETYQSESRHSRDLYSEERSSRKSKRSLERKTGSFRLGSTPKVSLSSSKRMTRSSNFSKEVIPDPMQEEEESSLEYASNDSVKSYGYSKESLRPGNAPSISVRSSRRAEEAEYWDDEASVFPHSTKSAGELRERESTRKSSLSVSKRPVDSCLETLRRNSMRSARRTATSCFGKEPLESTHPPSDHDLTSRRSKISEKLDDPRSTMRSSGQVPEIYLEDDGSKLSVGSGSPRKSSNKSTRISESERESEKPLGSLPRSSGRLTGSGTTNESRQPVTNSRHSTKSSFLNSDNLVHSNEDNTTKHSIQSRTDLGDERNSKLTVNSRYTLASENSPRGSDYFPSSVRDENAPESLVRSSRYTRGSSSLRSSIYSSRVLGSDEDIDIDISKSSTRSSRNSAYQPSFIEQERDRSSFMEESPEMKAKICSLVRQRECLGSRPIKCLGVSKVYQKLDEALETQAAINGVNQMINLYRPPIGHRSRYTLTFNDTGETPRQRSFKITPAAREDINRLHELLEAFFNILLAALDDLSQYKFDFCEEMVALIGQIQGTVDELIEHLRYGAYEDDLYAINERLIAMLDELEISPPYVLLRLVEFGFNIYELGGLLGEELLPCYFTETVHKVQCRIYVSIVMRVKANLLLDCLPLTRNCFFSCSEIPNRTSHTADIFCTGEHGPPSWDVLQEPQTLQTGTLLPL